MKKGAWFVLGAQWGDEGKGLISAYLSAREKAKLVCKGGVGPNAEHGIFTLDEKLYLKVNQLPLGWIFNPDCGVVIGSGVAVDPVKFLYETNRYNLGKRIKLDLRSPVVTQEHIDAERNSKGMNALGSTFSGSGYCRADFILRKAKQIRDLAELNEYAMDVSFLVNATAEESPIIVESSQGTQLSLAVSLDYPNTTSDNVTTSAVCDDILLSWKYIKEVVLVVKSLPSREGAGSMGSQELSLAEIEKRGLVEKSSIGGVTRRKASSLNFEMLKEAVRINGATQIALSFLDHYDPEVKNVKKIDDLTPRVWSLIEKIEASLNLPVTILNTGKAYNNIIDLTQNDAVDWNKIETYIQTLSKE